jgi:hypothetical protein
MKDAKETKDMEWTTTAMMISNTSGKRSAYLLLLVGFPDYFLPRNCADICRFRSTSSTLAELLFWLV